MDQIGSGTFMLGDCFERMAELPDASVDMVLADLPYGTTDCAWDSVIPLESLWPEYWRVLKAKCAVVLTASMPFSAALVMSQPRRLKAEWIWKKNAGSNFGTVKFQPMKEHERILVFGCGKTTYNPIMQERAEAGKKIMERGITSRPTTKGVGVYGNGALHSEYSNNHLDKNMRYPSSVQLFKRERGLHPTQKPVALFEYLIRTYTNPGDLVLDNTAGSGTTAIAAERSGRRWCCIERDEGYYAKAVERIINEVQTAAGVP